MNGDDYNGWKNRETWAFCLHLANDEGLYRTAQEWAREAVADYKQRMVEFDLPESDAGRASSVGRYVIEEAGELVELMTESALELGGSYEDFTTNPVVMMAREVGSWWRVDADEVGVWALELIEGDEA